ncbi:MAG: hypothetical protein U0350_49290 [Caldilineaceae bacterium]
MTTTTTTATNEQTKAPELTKAQQLQNCLFGLVAWFQLAYAVFWTLRLWLYQHQHGKPLAMPRLIVFLADSHSMGDVCRILSEWNIHRLPFVMHWVLNAGEAILECSVIVNGSQFDYADGVLSSQGVTLVNAPGQSRGYSFNHPLKQRQHTQGRQSAKLGKTYQ